MESCQALGARSDKNRSTERSRPGVGMDVPPERRKDREGGTFMPRLVIVVLPLKKMERGSYSLDRGQI